jgi:hypothetical protein
LPNSCSMRFAHPNLPKAKMIDRSRILVSIRGTPSSLYLRSETKTCLATMPKRRPLDSFRTSATSSPTFRLGSNPGLSRNTCLGQSDICVQEYQDITAGFPSPQISLVSNRGSTVQEIYARKPLHYRSGSVSRFSIDDYHLIRLAGLPSDVGEHGTDVILLVQSGDHDACPQHRAGLHCGARGGWGTPKPLLTVPPGCGQAVSCEEGIRFFSSPSPSRSDLALLTLCDEAGSGRFRPGKVGAGRGCKPARLPAPASAAQLQPTGYSIVSSITCSLAVWSGTQ